MSDYTSLVFEGQGAVARLRFNRPDVHNAPAVRKAEAFETAWLRIAGDDALAFLAKTPARFVGA